MKYFCQTFLVYQRYGFGVITTSNTSEPYYQYLHDLEEMEQLGLRINLWMPYIKYICENESPQDVLDGT